MYLILKNTQEKVPCTVEFAKIQELKSLKNWLFDWEKEYQNEENIIYKLITIQNNFIHGLTSVKKINKELLFLNLLETSPINKGKNKMYENVVGILFAYACKLSFDLGYDGFCAFDTKTVLQHHYGTTYGAIPLNAQRMYFDTKQAQILIDKYL